MRSFQSIRHAGRRSWPLLLDQLETRVVPSFVAPRSFDAGEYNIAVAMGDFNGDGRLDLAAVDNALAKVNVLLGNGDGSFQAARAFAIASDPGSLVVGDVNGDSLLDLVTASYGGNSVVSVLLGNGDGTFQAARHFPTGRLPQALALGDVNNDGWPDLATANEFGNNVSVLLGNGDGSFQAPRNFPVGNAPFGVALGDLNGDGRLDLAVTNWGSNNLSVLLGDGNGSFQAARNFPAGSRPFDVVFGEFNGDGFQDLVVTNLYLGENNLASVLLGNGDGTLQAVRSFVTGIFAEAVAVGEFNGDGRLDLAVCVYSGVNVLLGNGNGTFQAARNYPAGGSPPSVAIGDVNADGHLDFVAASGGASVLLGHGDGTFQTAPTYVIGRNPTAVAVGEFNGDGLHDLVTVNSDSDDVSVLLGDGAGSFQAARNSPVGGGPGSVAVGEFNGDGLLDLALTANVMGGSRVSVLLGHGDGTFQAPSLFFVRNVHLYSIVVGEFNGDGRQDLAMIGQDCEAACTDEQVHVLLGNGDGTFQLRQNISIGSYPDTLVVGEFNGDGRQDLAVTISEDHHVSVLLGNGDGSFQAARNIPTGDYPFGVAVGDFNSDGRQDLITADWNDGTVSVLLGNGDGTFQARRAFAASIGPDSVAVGDFNLDGFLDVAVTSNGTVRVLLGNGDGTLQTTDTSFIAGSRPEPLVVADFDRDGTPDLAVVNTDSFTHDLSILLNDGYWGGPAIFFVIFPDSGTLTAGAPFDVTVYALSAAFEIVTNYTGQVLFWSTDPLAMLPDLYRFQLADRGAASFPGGVTFNTPGVQELYVFDTATYSVIGYAVFTVTGAGPGGAPGSGEQVFDWFVGQELTRTIAPVRAPAVESPLSVRLVPSSVDHEKYGDTTGEGDMPPALLDQMFAEVHGRVASERSSGWLDTLPLCGNAWA